MNYSSSTKCFFLVLILVAVEIRVSLSYKPRRIKFASCYEETPKPIAVFMNCLNKKGECKIRKENVHKIRIFFRPKTASTDVTSYAAWNTFLPIPLPNQDFEACKYIYQCPLKVDKLNSFTYELSVESFWPSKKFPVIWTLTDKDTDEEIMCVKFMIDIQ